MKNMNFNIKKLTLKTNLNQKIAIAFFLIIILGTIALMLPISSKSPGSIGLTTSLFTSTSAVCVTGLSVVDVWSTYSFFGQFVILLLMETGGLGFMSIISILVHFTRQQTSIQSLSLMSESLGSEAVIKDITRIQKRLLVGSAVFELIGAIILCINFAPSLGLKDAIWFGIFHSVSAFCNAGFDLFGKVAPGSGLTTLQGNPVVLITVAVLITVGGIGFIVWDDILSSKHIRKWSIYTKLVLITTFSLIVLGAVLFYVLECDNTETFGCMDSAQKLVHAFFQSVTPRTAGFAAVDQSSLSGASIALTCILMIIGGSTGSTAGGIKTVTALIVINAAFSSAFGKKSATIFKRTITQEQIKNAYTILNLFLFLSIIGSFIIYISSGVSFTDALFESISALATVGLSLGITGSLSLLSKLIIIVFMYIGRVGLLTLTMGFLKTKDTGSIKYPSVNLLIG